jgi:hypothetical protein
MAPKSLALRIVEQEEERSRRGAGAQLRRPPGWLAKQVFFILFVLIIRLKRGAGIRHRDHVGKIETAWDLLV